MGPGMLKTLRIYLLDQRFSLITFAVSLSLLPLTLYNVCLQEH